MQQTPLRGTSWLSTTSTVVAVMLAAVAALAVPLSLLGVWRWWAAAGVVAAVAAGIATLLPRLSGPRLPAGSALAIVTIAATAAVWAGVTHGEHIVIRRDAGSYAQFGHHLATAGQAKVDVSFEALGGDRARPLFAADRVTVASPAFYARGGDQDPHVVPQFMIGAPAWLSSGWWLGGWTGLLLVPAVMLGLALIAFGQLAARLVGPRWAVLATALLAGCFPVLHVGQGTYSEPFALLLGCVGLGLLYDAVNAGPTGRAHGLRALLAGLLLGAVCLFRIDGLREVGLLLPVAAVWAFRQPARARIFVRGLALATAGSLLAAAVLTLPYLITIKASLVPLLAIIAALAVLSLWGLRRARRGRRLLPASAAAALSGPRAPIALAGLAAVGLAALVTRPLWLTVRQPPDKPEALFVAGVQASRGLPIDGGRTYAEQTVAWVSWWLGWPTVVLAGIAVVWGGWALGGWLQASDRMSRPLPHWWSVAVVGLGASALTLLRPGITADHPWADRRLVAGVLPATVLLAVAGALLLARAAARYGPAHSAAWRASAATVAATALTLAPTLAAAWPLAGQTTERGQVSAVKQVCASFGPLDTAIIIDSRAANEWPQVIRSVCGVPAVTVWRSSAGPAGETQQSATISELAVVISAAGRRPILIAAQERDRLVQLSADPPRQLVKLRTTEDDRQLIRRPREVAPLTIELWSATVR